MTLYFADSAGLKLALELAGNETEAKIVLVGDGVYPSLPELAPGVKVFAIEDDVRRRGATTRISPSIKLIGYAELVDLIIKHKVINLA